jgi:hypothetical protein
VGVGRLKGLNHGGELCNLAVALHRALFESLNPLARFSVDHCRDKGSEVTIPVSGRLWEALNPPISIPLIRSPTMVRTVFLFQLFMQIRRFSVSPELGLWYSFMTLYFISKHFDRDVF